MTVSVNQKREGCDMRNKGKKRTNFSEKGKKNLQKCCKRSGAGGNGNLRLCGKSSENKNRKNKVLVECAMKGKKKKMHCRDKSGAEVTSRVGPGHNSIQGGVLVAQSEDEKCLQRTFIVHMHPCRPNPVFIGALKGVQLSSEWHRFWPNATFSQPPQMEGKQLPNEPNPSPIACAHQIKTMWDRETGIM